METETETPSCCLCGEKILSNIAININHFPKGELCFNCDSGWYYNLKLEIIKNLELNQTQLEYMAIKYLEKRLKRQLSNKKKPKYQNPTTAYIQKKEKEKNPWDEVLGLKDHYHSEEEWTKLACEFNINFKINRYELYRDYVRWINRDSEIFPDKLHIAIPTHAPTFYKFLLRKEEIISEVREEDGTVTFLGIKLKFNHTDYSPK